MSGPFDKELSALKVAGKPSYTKTHGDSEGKHYDGIVSKAKTAGYETKSHVDTDTATETKLHKDGHTIRLYRNKGTARTHATHSMDYEKSPARMRRRQREEEVGPKYQSGEAAINEEEAMTTDTGNGTTVMHEQALAVVDSVIRGNSAEATRLFADLVHEKAQGLVDDVRTELQTTLFAEPVEEEAKEEEDPEGEKEPVEEALDEAKVPFTTSRELHGALESHGFHYDRTDGKARIYDGSGHKSGHPGDKQGIHAHLVDNGFTHSAKGDGGGPGSSSARNHVWKHPEHGVLRMNDHDSEIEHSRR